MSTRVVEILRRLVRQQTVQIGQPVANLYGAVAAESPPLLRPARQTWLWVRAPGRSLLDIEDFFASLNASGGSTGGTSGMAMEEVEGRDGMLVLEPGAGIVSLVRGTVKVPNSLVLPISVATGASSGEFAIYVDGVLQRRGSDAASLRLSLDRGDHLIEVLAYTTSLGIAVPPSIEITAALDLLQKPEWRSVSPGYMDPTTGMSAVRLEWYDDPRAGGWKLMRRELDDLGPILAVGPADARGEFVLTLSGNMTQMLVRGEELSAASLTMGTVLGATYGDVDDQTSVHVRLDAALSDVSPLWVGRPCGSGQLTEIARIRRSSVQGSTRYDDVQVRNGTVYEYRLQAFSVLSDAILSPWSDLAYVRAGDVVPPGAITFKARYPRVTPSGIVVAKFSTPTDEDYAGVHVYFDRTVHTGTLAAHDAVSFTAAEPLTTGVVYSGTTLTIPSLEGDSEDLYLVTSASGPVLFVSGAISVTYAPGVTFEVHDVRRVKTDYGTPGSDDDFTFDAVRGTGADGTENEVLSGTYHFRSFDWAGNELLSGSPAWAVTYAFDRQPLTRVHFENKGLDGAVSTTVVQATFGTEPAISDLYSGDVGYIDTDQWRVSGDPVFHSGDFVEGETDWMFVRVWAPNDPDIPIQVRRLVAVDPDGTIYTDQPFITDGVYGVKSGDRWTVMDGATYWYTGVERAPTKASLLPIYGPQYFVRASGEAAGKYAEFYSRIDGMLEEDLQRYFVDNDDVPHIHSLYLSEPSPYVLRVRIADLDDDVKYWKCYSKKAEGEGRRRVNAPPTGYAWPTLNGQSDGPVDDTYLRWYEHIDQGLAFSHNAGPGTWNVVIVPENSVGLAGPRLTASKSMNGLEDDEAILYNYWVREHDDASSGRFGNLISWEHSLATESPEPAEIRIYARRSDSTDTGATTSTGGTGRQRVGSSTGSSAPTTTQITWAKFDGGRQRVGEIPPNRRWVDQDAEAGTDPWIAELGDGTDYRSLGGSFVHSGLPPRLPAGQGTPITWIYTLELRDHTTAELIAAYETQYTAHYDVDTPPTDDGGGGGGDPVDTARPAIDAASAVIAYAGRKNTTCSDPHVQRVSWTSRNVSMDHFWRILVRESAVDGIGSPPPLGPNWTTLVGSLPYTHSSYDVSFPGRVMLGSTANEITWRRQYRVELRSSTTGELIMARETGELDVTLYSCQSSTGGAFGSDFI